MYQHAERQDMKQEVLEGGNLGNSFIVLIQTNSFYWWLG